MKIGTRILYPEETEYWEAELLQISVYHGMKNNQDIMFDCVNACKKSGIRYVLHPVGYSLLKEEMLQDIITMAKHADLALILHDERTSSGGRIEEQDKEHLLNAINEIKAITNISFENAANTHDVHWFWNTFTESITIDIGHIESSGLDPVDFVQRLNKECIDKIDYVHMHRNNGLRGGITDHWPLTTECREVRALRELARIKSDLNVILEINEIEMINESLKILRVLREELPD